MKGLFAFALAVTSMSRVTVLADTGGESKIGTLRVQVHLREEHSNNEASQVVRDELKNSAEVPDQSFQINQNKTSRTLCWYGTKTETVP